MKNRTTELIRPPILAITAAASLLAAAFSTASFAHDAGLTDDPPSGKLTLHLRSRVETRPGSGRFHVITKTVHWDPHQTAIIICDMWNQHWCRGATRRVTEMAPRMNQLIQAARQRGVLIIHAPSGTMGYYKDRPQRRLAQQAPTAKPRAPLKGWCRLDPDREPPLPIDDSDGGCDCQPRCKLRNVSTHQIDTIEIKPGDAISDSNEIHNLLHQRGIDNVIIMGVHTNMCVLGRPFGIRQMVYQGKNVALMRDLTDTMYNSRRRPYVSHFTGTDLVIAHIEKYWCPTVTSADLLGGKPFRFRNDRRRHVAIIMAEREYDTARTLPAFALRYLGKDFKLSYVYAREGDRNDLPGIEVLDVADLALISVRRRMLPDRQMAVVRRFIDAGKPLVGIRTASHAFALPAGKHPAPGYVTWPQFDRDVLGGNYHGHYPQRLKTYVWVVPGAAKHPIVKGMPHDRLPVASSLYKTSPLRPGATALMFGQAEGQGRPPEPVAWTFRHAGGGRVFYTSLGHPDDFKLPAFCRLLQAGVYWAAGLPVPPPPPPQ